MKNLKTFEAFINEAIEFDTPEDFKAYATKHKVRPTTEVIIGGKKVKAGEVKDDSGKEEEKDEKQVEVKEFKAYHTSFGPIKKFNSKPTWFTKDIELAKAYHKNTLKQNDGVAHTYQIVIKGRILGLDEAEKFASEAGIDHESTVVELTESPGPEDIKRLIGPYQKICDGFDQWDYDPRDWGDAESTVIFNPSKTVTIVKELFKK
jgi:hypothetical protein